MLHIINYGTTIRAGTVITLALLFLLVGAILFITYIHPVADKDPAGRLQLASDRLLYGTLLMVVLVIYYLKN